MGAADLPDSVPGSELETGRFGITVGRLVVQDRASATIDAVVDLLERSDHDVVVLRYPAREVEWAAPLSGVGGRTAIHADTLVYWTADIAGAVADPSAEVRSRRLGPGDAELLDDLVRDVFRDYGSHYRANPLFDPEAALAGYQEWARSSLVADRGGVIAIGEPDAYGVATVERTDDRVEILLAGIRSAEQGRGRYADLLAAVGTYARAHDCTALVISTQVRNIAVQRVWARQGLLPSHAFETVHLVRSALLAEPGG